MRELMRKIFVCLVAVVCFSPWMVENVCESFRVVNGSQITLFAKVEPVAMESIVNVMTAKNEEDFLKALKFVNQDIELYPDKAIFYFIRSELYKKERLNNRKARLEDLDKAIELNPKFARAYSLRADEYFADREYDKAIAYYNKVIELEPANVYPYRRRADVYTHKKDYDKVLENCSTVIDKAPYSCAMENYQRAQIYYKNAQYDEVIQDCNMIITGNEEAENKIPRHSDYSFVMESLDDSQDKSTIGANDKKLDVKLSFSVEKNGCEIPAQEEYFFAQMSDEIRKRTLPLAYLLRGRAYYKQGKYQEALDDGYRVLEDENIFAESENNMQKKAEELISKAEDALADS